VYRRGPRGAWRRLWLLLVSTLCDVLEKIRVLLQDLLRACAETGLEFGVIQGAENKGIIGVLRHLGRGRRSIHEWRWRWSIPVRRGPGYSAKGESCIAVDGVAREV